MKPIFFLALVLFFSDCATIKVVYIPDANFKAALLANKKLNKNGDTEIEVREAEAFADTIDVSNKGITTLIGIAAFTKLKVLNCSNNKLTTLELSANTALTEISCWYNKLDTLDVSKNVALTHIDCSSNELNIFDVSKNINLEILICFDNELTSLDIATNTALTEINCGGNELNILDLLRWDKMEIIVSNSIILHKQVIYRYKNQNLLFVAYLINIDSVSCLL
jgi:Leucine-rich repeat (LRR) protein